MQFKIFVPHCGDITDIHTYFNTIGRNGAFEDAFYNILRCNYINAAQHANWEITDDLKDDGSIYITSAFFITSENSHVHYMCITKKLLVVDDCNDRFFNSIIKIIQNPYIIRYLTAWDANHINSHNVFTPLNNAHTLYNPMGTADILCKKEFIKDKKILLDEAHRIICDNIQSDLLCVQLYKKTLEICRILHTKYGYEIYSFSGRDSNILLDAESNWIHILKKDGFIPYTDMLEIYKTYSLFFHFYQETHGYSVYENYQCGNGVITYTESFNILNQLQYQTGVSLAYKMPNTLCADLIHEWYASEYTSEQKNKIQKWAYHTCSSDMWCKRIEPVLHNFFHI